MILLLPSAQPTASSQIAHGNAYYGAVADRLDNTTSGKAVRVRKTPTVPALFYTATALAFAGVTAHYAANNWISRRRPVLQYWVRQLHYIFMPASIAVAAVAVSQAQSQNWRVAKGSAHAYIGIGVLIAMSASAGLALLQYVPRYRPVAGRLHRLLGAHSDSDWGLMLLSSR